MKCVTNYNYLHVLSHSVMFDSLRSHGLQPGRLLCPWNFPGKNTGAGCHFLLQGIFLTQGSNSCISRWILLAAPPGKSCTTSTGLYNYLHKCPSNSIIQSICYQTFTEHIQCARHCPSLRGSMFHKTNKPLSELAYTVSLYPFRAKTRGHRNQEPTSVSHHPRSCHRI